MNEVEIKDFCDWLKLVNIRMNDQLKVDKKIIQKIGLKR